MEKVAWTMTQAWTSFDFPMWNTSKSQASPTGAGNLPPVELETRTNSCWGKLAPKENKGSVCPCSVLSPNHQMWVALPCGKWMRVWERQRLQLLLRSRSYYLMRQALGGGDNESVVILWGMITDQTDGQGQLWWDPCIHRALLLEAEKLRSWCLLLTLWTLVSQPVS